MKTNKLLYIFGLWLALSGMALAQNSIETFDVAQQGGKIIIRITTKDPLTAVPPNFAVTNPARIAFDFSAASSKFGLSPIFCRTSQLMNRGPKNMHRINASGIDSIARNGAL